MRQQQDHLQQEPRRRADGARNRAHLLDIAGGMLAEDPDVSMAAIADNAGLSRKSVYAHFHSREALISTLLDRDIARIQEALTHADLDQGSAQQALARGMRAISAPALELRSRRRAYEAVLGSQVMRQRRHHATRQLTAVVARGQHEGQFRADLPAAAFEAMADAISRALSETVDAGLMAAQDVPRHITDAMTRLLAPSSSGSRQLPHET